MQFLYWDDSYLEWRVSRVTAAREWAAGRVLMPQTDRCDLTGVSLLKLYPDTFYVHDFHEALGRG